MAYQGRLKIGAQFLVSNVNGHKQYLRIGPAPAGYQLYCAGFSPAELHAYDAGSDSWSDVSIPVDMTTIENIWTKGQDIYLLGHSTAIGGHAIWESADAGATWNAHSVGGADTINQMVVDAGGRVWVIDIDGSGNPQIEYSDDRGATVVLSTALPTTASTSTGTDGLISARGSARVDDANRIAFFYEEVTDGSLHSYVTADHGASWVDTKIADVPFPGDTFRAWINSWTKDGVLTVSFFPNEPGPPIYVFYSDDDGVSWNDISASFPANADTLNAASVGSSSILSMEDNVASTDKLWVGDGKTYTAHLTPEVGVAQHEVGEDHTSVYIFFGDFLTTPVWKVASPDTWSPTSIADVGAALSTPIPSGTY